MKRIIILGTEYLMFIDSEDVPASCDGTCDPSTKVIKIAKMAQEPDSLQDMAERRKCVMRHEILHAFLFESGLWAETQSPSAWAMNEEAIDWMAIQAPKIFKVYQEAGCM